MPLFGTFGDAKRREMRAREYVAALMTDAGLIVLVALISPYRAVRAHARSLFAPGEFLEVFVDAPLAECERRDPKGLYAKARAGALPDFTGIDSPYEAPETPDVHLRTTGRTVDECADEVLTILAARSQHG